MTADTTLEGVLERIVFNEENNFTVARIQSGHSRDLITIVGNLADPNPGETLRHTGRMDRRCQIWTAVPGRKMYSVLPL